MKTVAEILHTHAERSRLETEEILELLLEF
jgi:hypothetical protein